MTDDRSHAMQAAVDSSAGRRVSVMNVLSSGLGQDTRPLLPAAIDALAEIQKRLDDLTSRVRGSANLAFGPVPEAVAGNSPPKAPSSSQAEEVRERLYGVHRMLSELESQVDRLINQLL